MRIAAIACAAVVGLAAASASAGCDWHTAKAADVVASTTSATAAPAQSTPVKLPDTEKQG